MMQRYLYDPTIRADTALSCLMNALSALSRAEPAEGRTVAATWIRQATNALKGHSRERASPTDRARLAAADAILADIVATLECDRKQA